MIAGFHTAEQVRGTLAALRTERRQHEHDKARVKVIDEQIAIFQAEHERFKAEDLERLEREAERAQRAADAAAGGIT